MTEARAADVWEWSEDGRVLTRNGRYAGHFDPAGAVVAAVLGSGVTGGQPQGRTLYLEGEFPDPDAACRRLLEACAKAGRWVPCPTPGCDCTELTLTFQKLCLSSRHDSPKQATSTPRRLPPVDCTTPLPVKFIQGPPYPSWVTQPDQPADEHTPAVSNAYLDDDDTSDGLNLFRAVGWCLLMWVVAGVLVAVWWLAIRS